MIGNILLGVIAIILLGILYALKSGINEIVKGLESLDSKLTQEESLP